MFMNIISDFKVEVSSFLRTPNAKKIFLISFFIYFVALYPLMRADVFYIDDYKSAGYNYTSWNHFSRYVATFLQWAIRLFSDLADIDPFGRLIGIALLSIASMMIVYILNKRLSILGTIATLPLGLSPFFLENLSYRYDSFYMCFSIFIAILPFLFMRNLLLFIISSIICLTLMYCSYQASSGVYLLFGLYMIFYLFFVAKDINNSLYFGASFAISFIVTTLYYKLFMVHSFGIIDYVSPDAIPFSHLFSGVFANISKYLTYIYNDLLNTQYILLCIVVIVLFIFSFANLDSTNNPYRQANLDSAPPLSSFPKTILLFSALLFLVIAFPLSYGAYLVLVKPLFQPRAFIGSGFLISLLCLVVVLKPHIFKNIIVILLSYSCVIFALAYGNALGAQMKYIDFRSAILAQDLAHINSNKEVVIRGGIGYALPTQKFINIYGNIAERLMPKILNNDDFTFNIASITYLKLPYTYCIADCLKNLKLGNKISVLLDSKYEKISEYKDYLVVELKDSPVDILF